MSREVEEKMMQYIRSLGEDHPPADSHYSLREIYFQYGIHPVDDWLNNYYEKCLDKGRQEG